jgi:nucleoside-diphosphate-sugar epimerase
MVLKDVNCKNILVVGSAGYIGSHVVLTLNEAGYHVTRKSPYSQYELTWLSIARDVLTHRGPDSAGEWSSPDQRVFLAHRRLAISVFN